MPSRIFCTLNTCGTGATGAGQEGGGGCGTWGTDDRRPPKSPEVAAVWPSRCAPARGEAAPAELQSPRLCRGGPPRLLEVLPGNCPKGTGSLFFCQLGRACGASEPVDPWSKGVRDWERGCRGPERGAGAVMGCPEMSERCVHQQQGGTERRARAAGARAWRGTADHILCQCFQTPIPPAL